MRVAVHVTMKTVLTMEITRNDDVTLREIKDEARKHATALCNTGLRLANHQREFKDPKFDNPEASVISVDYINIGDK